MGEPEKTNHILTEGQREFLRGKKDLTDGSERQTRTRIRKRILNALCDSWYLAELDEKEFEIIFDPDRGHPWSTRHEAHQGSNSGAGGKDREFQPSRRKIEYDSRRGLSNIPNGGGRDEEPTEAEITFTRSFEDLIAFTYRAISHLPEVDFEEVVEVGVKRGALEQDNLVDVDVNLEAIDVDDIDQKMIEDLHPLQHMHLLNEDQDISQIDSDSS